MSRKWARMVNKNQKTINAKRKKTGATPIGTVLRDKPVTFKGRYWILPGFLIIMTLFNVYLTASTGNLDKNTWILLGVYILLALLLVVINRPTLSVGKNALTSRRFTGFQTFQAYEIEEIRLMQNAIVVQMKDKKKRWSFTRLVHIFPIAAATKQLEEFAVRNGVKVV